jgi:hypothetical protein
MSLRQKDVTPCSEPCHLFVFAVVSSLNPLHI